MGAEDAAQHIREQEKYPGSSLPPYFPQISHQGLPLAEPSRKPADVEAWEMQPALPHPAPQTQGTGKGEEWI